MTSLEVIKKIEDSGMIPVFYHADIEVAIKVLDASYAGGVRVFEFTNRGENAFDVFVKLLSHAAQYEDLILGIGTIMDDATTRKFIDAGAHFVVSPIMKPSMSKVCQAHDIPWIPGCGTLTEMVNALEAGAQVVKMFPGSILGPAFVSTVRPVVPALKLMPTGGVEPTEESLSAWFNAGVVCVGMGSQLYKKEMLANKDWKTLQLKIAEALAIIKRIRNR
jgi:2-dehydro-3-deoxyphosphogluconate aldolase/(4S)-4-hydroxy-2-oxoglutarate aldolase